MNQPQRHIKALQRRLDWLTDRLVQSKQDLSYDKAERAALKWAIAELTNSNGPQGQKGSSNHGPNNSERTGNNNRGAQKASQAAILDKIAKSFGIEVLN